MIKAIVYTTNTGYTAEYAALLGGRIDLPVYSFEEAEKKTEHGSEIIYLGWLNAGSVSGYAKASRLFYVKAVCGVGMGASGSQIADVRMKNKLSEQTPVFTLQGGFDMKKLHGMYKFMMTVMKAALGSKMKKKENRTPEEDAMLDMLYNGASYVSEANLSPVIEWYVNNK